MAHVKHTATSALTVLTDASWTSTPATSTYYMPDFFSPKVFFMKFKTREEAIEALKSAYLGPDSDGIGVVLPEA